MFVPSLWLSSKNALEYSKLLRFVPFFHFFSFFIRRRLNGVKSDNSVSLKDGHLQRIEIILGGACELANCMSDVTSTDILNPAKHQRIVCSRVHPSCGRSSFIVAFLNFLLSVHHGDLPLPRQANPLANLIQAQIKAC